MTLFFVLSGFVIHYNYARLVTARASGIGAISVGAVRAALSALSADDAHLRFGQQPAYRLLDRASGTIAQHFAGAAVFPACRCRAGSTRSSTATR